MKHNTRMVKTDLSLNEYESDLRAKGFKEIGEGAYARVYLHPGKRRVYKVGALDRWVGEGNVAYLAFIKKVISDNTNPWFPKIYSVKKFKMIAGKDSEGFYNKSEKYYVVSMERLNKVKDATLKAEMLETLIDFYKQFDKVFNISMPVKSVKQFVSAMRTLSTLSNIGLVLDVHGGNIMTRKNGQLVITDPVC